MRRIACITGETDDCKVYLHELQQRNSAMDIIEDLQQSDLSHYEIIVVLGGDGLMLKVLHKIMESALTWISVYGVNCGSLGFLMNKQDFSCLEDKLESAVETTLHPIQMNAYTSSGEYVFLAVNEVALLRQTHQSVNIRVLVNDLVKIEKFVGDGIMVATPAGSSAYNFAAHGPIVPLQIQAMLLTPISPFRPRRWRGAIIPQNSSVELQICSPENRPVSATADFKEVRDVISVRVTTKQNVNLRILFDPNDSLEERVLKEQFATE